MRIILAHPGQQHSFRVAVALKDIGVLEKFYTCIYDLPSSFSMRLAHWLVRGEDAKKILKRKDERLSDSDVKTYYTFLSLVVIILSRSRYTKKLSLWLDRKISYFFGIKIAKNAIREKADAVICFSNNETSCFKFLSKRAPWIKRIVDCANAPAEYMREIYQNDMIKYQHEGIKREIPELWNDKNIQSQRMGLELTDYFLAPSKFVKKGLINCGVVPEKIKVLYYGTLFPVRTSFKNHLERKLIRFLYVGQVTHRKGIHHLCHIFTELSGAELIIVGAYDLNGSIYTKYKSIDNISFVGRVSHDEVMRYMDEADIFIFPSLADSFSLACVEAMSRGLPVICSDHTGASDLIKNGVNGFVFNSEEEVEIKNICNFIMGNANLISSMSKNAAETVANYSWDNYTKNLRHILETIITSK